MTERVAEQFVTLFDSSFLPQGITLAESLRNHSPGCELWVICMDEEVEHDLSILGIPALRCIPLREIEDPRLLQVKPGRTAREYCWTLTAFSFDAVFERAPRATRVTYLDADLFFLDSPRSLFDELEGSGASILLTEHNFDPAYDKSRLVGRFCVQFLTMDRSERAREARHWWQERVLEWCFDRIEPGRFGDQKYLDLWPALFGDRIHVLGNRKLALAPWNIAMEAKRTRGVLTPAFYHFHSFRLVSSHRARSVEGGYAIPRSARRLYRAYAAALGASIQKLATAGIRVRTLPLPRRPFGALRHLAKLALGRADVYMRIRRPS